MSDNCSSQNHKNPLAAYLERPLSRYFEASLKSMDHEIETSIFNGLSGAVLHLGDGDGVLYQKAFGFQRRYNEKELMAHPEPMREDCLFDLASLTKIFSTMLCYHILLDRKEIDLDDKLSKYLPGFSAPDKRDITLRLLLQHNSGLPSSFHFYNPAQAGSEMYSRERERTISLLSKVPMKSTPGTQTVYSDLNFIALGAVIEKVSGIRQDRFLESEICTGLGLKNTGYAPLENQRTPQECESTERCGNTRDGRVWFPGIRTHTLQGQVQDETAFYAMNQISGNAGLFSSAHDLGVLCRLLLNEGSLGNYRLCSPEIVYMFRKTFNIDKTYALGWELAGSNIGSYGSIVHFMSPLGDAVGHTGWTGKCVVIDFRHNVYFILLNNKKHSPVLPLLDNSDVFSADITSTGKYGAISNLFFRGLVEVL